MLDREVQKLVIRITPEAMERCYVAGEILRNVLDAPDLEYGLIGLADWSHPLHVIATPLLPGQRVSSGEVYQAGHAVLRMRREIGMLSKQTGLRLVPTMFIHRHLHRTEASHVDHEFLTTVFIDQVSTVVRFRDTSRPGVRAVCRRCMAKEPGLERPSESFHRPTAECREYGIAASLIVNLQRNHSLYAVRKERCSNCDEYYTTYLPAVLRVTPQQALGDSMLEGLRKTLRAEIKAKVSFEQGRSISQELSA